MIHIENMLSNKILRFLFKAKLMSLLKIVPADDLIGIDKIVLIEKHRTNRDGNIVAGHYYNKESDRAAYIEIYVSGILNNEPLACLLLPIFGTFYLGGVLYHEIGHHYCTVYSHGININKREEYANSYKDRMLKRKFLPLVRVVYPIYYIVTLKFLPFLRRNNRPFKWHPSDEEMLNAGPKKK